MRGIPAIVLVAILVLAPVALAQQSVPDRPPEFGRGELGFRAYDVPTPSAGEPTIGIPWNTDSLFYHEQVRTFRARFDAHDEVTWDDVTPPYQIPINLDPMLIADVDTGRVFAGGLHGPCSIMMVSDDDGNTWLPTANMCSGSNFDHQSIGVGKPAGPVPGLPIYPHVAYYCAQGGTISCARSLDGGQVWLPFQDVDGPCQGFHGHIRSNPTDGFVAVPVSDCGGNYGYLSTSDGGLNWQSNKIPGTEKWTNGFDPSLQFSRPSGWMYYAMASDAGIHVAMSKDEGKTWEPLGATHGKADTWLDVGMLANPPVVAGVFPALQAGDDDRVAFAFIGLEGGPGKDLEFLRSPQIYQCEDRQDELVWYYYLARSLDAGQTWTVTKVSDDPVQVGGIWDVTIGGDGSCRNLLDFQDMDIDSHGRIHIGLADGCTQACAKDHKAEVVGYRDAKPVVFRQTSGHGLFAEFDLELPVIQRDTDGDGVDNNNDTDIDGDGIPNQSDPDVDGDANPNDTDLDTDSDGIDDREDTNLPTPMTVPTKDSPGLPLVLLAAVLATGAVIGRKRI